MPSWLPSIEYPPAREGYWSPVTSTLNWCEEDYYAVFYIAEIVNTFTNLLFAYLAIKGIVNCVKHGHDPIFLVTFVGYLLVGIGSFSFHASLTYPMQLVDELSMIYTTCFMCYATFSYSRTRVFAITLGVGLVSLAIFITGYYHFLQNPAFHQNAYAILTAIVLLNSMRVMEFSLRPSLRRKEEEDVKASGGRRMTNDEKELSRSVDRRDSEILGVMWTMVVVGLSVFLGGFGIWHLDNRYCSILRVWRRNIGLPWGILLEGHGWWHIMTGVGAYYYIVWGIWLRHCLNGRQDEYILKWPRLYTLPEVVRSTNSNGEAQNRVSKKHR